MKNSLKTIILAAAALMCAGCATELIPGVYITGPYIQNYYDGELSVYVNQGPTAGLPMVSVGVNLNGDVPVTVYGRNSNDTEKYYELCEKHSDMSFNGDDRYFDNPAKRCFAHDLASIELVSDSDFDASHPAGSSLLDIMNYSASSLTRWIRNGYRMSSFVDDCFVLDKKADTLERDDLSLLCYFNLFQLEFTSVPSISRTHKLTLTLVYDDGTVKTLSAKVTFV